MPGKGRGLAHRWSGVDHPERSDRAHGPDRNRSRYGRKSEGVFRRPWSSVLDALAGGDLERSGLNLVVQDGAIDADALAE